MTEIATWFAERVPRTWFTGPPAVAADGDEVMVVGRLADAPNPAAAIDRFRGESRAERIAIAAEAESRFGRKVAWGAECGSVRRVFTSLSVPVMTRLRFEERRVLDTLVESGVARSRSHALAWCVHLVGEHQGEWISELRDALRKVNEVRARGPQ